MTLYRCLFDTYEEILAINIFIEENGMVQAIRIVSIIVDIIVKIKTKKIKLKDMLYISKMKKNFFLVNKLVLHGYKVQFDENGCFIKILDRNDVAKDFRNCNFYFIKYKKMNRIEVATFVKFSYN